MTMRSEAEHRGDALKQLESRLMCTVPNAAVLMGIHHHTLRQYIDKGFVEVLTIGKRPWVTADEIARYQKEGKRAPDCYSQEA